MLTPEERKEIHDLQHGLNKILRALNGNELTREKGFIDRLIDVEKRMHTMEYKMKRLTWVLVGFVGGTLLGAAIFGIITWETFIKIVK